MPTPLKKLLDGLSSFGLSCSILFFMFVLTWAGTWYQVYNGLHEAQIRYFESWFVVHRMGRLAVPLPGGQLLMALLAVNLAVGGLWRIRKSWRTAGIIVVHIGIVGLLLSALVKHRFSSEGHLTFYPGDEETDYVHYTNWEVAIHDALDQEGVQEWIIPQDDFDHLRGDRSRKFSSDELPFDLVLSRFEPNAAPRRAHEVAGFVHPIVDGYTLEPRPTEKQAERNAAGLYLTVTERATGEQTKAILWGLENWPLVFEAGGRRWAINLRHEHFDIDFAVRLDEFQKQEHARTNIPSDYSSFVTVTDADGPTKVHIRMNEPLRRDGFVLFQSGWGPKEARPGDRLFSTLAVHQNPSDKWPEYSCWVIGIGMLIAFLHRLFKWITATNKRRQRALQLES